MKWAPDPLASDSSFAALSALPADSLGVNQSVWVGVQREWRLQRLGESAPGDGPRSITEPDVGPRHVARPNDQRFAALASRPYASLSQGELTWLMMESGAQRNARQFAPRGGDVIAIFLSIAAIAGVVAVAMHIHNVHHFHLDW